MEVRPADGILKPEQELLQSQDGHLGRMRLNRKIVERIGSPSGGIIAANILFCSWIKFDSRIPK